MTWGLLTVPPAGLLCGGRITGHEENCAGPRRDRREVASNTAEAVLCPSVACDMELPFHEWVRRGGCSERPTRRLCARDRRARRSAGAWCHPHHLVVGFTWIEGSSEELPP